ncbi:MAG: hypothetical protein U9R05_03270 [Chloroflexota bacterium]|nr:hypothetical protein [Chloroflexota bacterium]
MILIINGPCGIGKTTVAWELVHRFDRAVMLEGDSIGAVHPFEIYDDSRVEHLYQTLRRLIAFHIERGNYHNFVIDYVFERPESLARLKSLLADFDDHIHAFRLLVAPMELEQRICERGEDPAWHLRRAKELVAIQTRAARRGDVGAPVDTTGLSVAQAADVIWQKVQT